MSIATVSNDPNPNFGKNESVLYKISLWWGGRIDCVLVNALKFSKISKNVWLVFSNRNWWTGRNRTSCIYYTSAVQSLGLEQDQLGGDHIQMHKHLLYNESVTHVALENHVMNCMCMVLYIFIQFSCVCKSNHCSGLSHVAWYREICWVMQ